MMARLTIFAVITGLMLSTGLCAEEINPVVGKGGNLSLRETDVERLIGYQSPEVQKSLREDPAQRAEFVRQLLLTRLVAEKARTAGFDKKPEMKEQLGYAMDQFIAREFIEKVVAADVTVSEEELKKYYREHQNEFLLPESVKARQIFIEAAKTSPPEVRNKARAKVEEILARLKKGEDFAGLAKELSQDADTAARGGELGWISPGKTNSVEFEKALFAMKAGGTGDIIETPFGYHIVRVDERKEKRTATYDEGKEYIQIRLKDELAQKKIREYLDKLVKEGGVEVAGAKGN